MSMPDEKTAPGKIQTFAGVINETLREEMERDEGIIVMGTDVSGRGAFGLEAGLYDRWPERVRDTPISEPGYLGTAIGAAIGGLHPYVSILYCDFLLVAMDQICNHAAKMRLLSGGQVKVPLVIQTSIGRGRSAGAQHSQALLSPFMHMPGLKIMIPSTPYDTKGLLKTALRDENPIVFFTHLMLLRDVKSFVPEGDYTIPFAVADVKREGEDVTVVATLYMVPKALAAADELSKEGISVEVIDPRTLVPLDEEAILASVKKTGRLIIVEDGCKRCGVGAEIAAIVAEKAIDYLEAPIQRVATLDIPIPYNPLLERYAIPDENSIIKAVKQTIHFS